MKGQPRNTGRKVSEAEFRRMWGDNTLTIAEIGKRLGVTGACVSNRAKRRGLPSRNAPLVSARERKIDCPDFAGMWSAGVSTAAMAAHYGVANATIWYTARRHGLPSRTLSRWHMISVADYRAVQLREAMAASAQKTAEALRRSGMVDYHAGNKRRSA